MFSPILTFCEPKNHIYLSRDRNFSRICQLRGSTDPPRNTRIMGERLYFIGAVAMVLDPGARSEQLIFLRFCDFLVLLADKLGAHESTSWVVSSCLLRTVLLITAGWCTRCSHTAHNKECNSVKWAAVACGISLRPPQQPKVEVS